MKAHFDYPLVQVELYISVISAANKKEYFNRALDKREYLMTIFLISHGIHML